MNLEDEKPSESRIREVEQIVMSLRELLKTRGLGRQEKKEKKKLEAWLARHHRDVLILGVRASPSILSQH